MPHTAPQLEQLAFSLHDGSDAGFARAREKLIGKDDLLDPIALAGKAGAPRAHFVESFQHDRKVRACDGVVQSQDDVSCAHALTVAHEQLADNPAGRMLDLLHVGIDDHRPRRDHGAGQLGRCGPAADTARSASTAMIGTADQVTADRTALVADRLLCHGTTRPLCVTILSGAGLSRLTANHASQHVFLWSEGLLPSLVHHQHMIHGRQRARTMRHDDDDAAPRADAENGVRECLLALGIEIGIRFVQHHEKRLAVERAGKRDALTLAGRQSCSTLAELRLDTPSAG